MKLFSTRSLLGAATLPVIAASSASTSRPSRPPANSRSPRSDLLFVKGFGVGQPIVYISTDAGQPLTSVLNLATARSDGKPEVAYNGHPLYLYAADQKPGDTIGHGITAFGGGWFTVSSTGNMVSGTAPNAGGADGY